MPPNAELPESLSLTRCFPSAAARAGFAAALMVVALLLVAPRVEARTLSFEERVAAQRAIEQVYWNHRIWPAQNSGAKPPLSEVMPDAAIQAKVESCLEKSKALETEWQRPLTAAQLQAELDRMAGSTHDPDMLRELFAALANDPFLIAETLVRETLADALIRHVYTTDPRLRVEARRDAAATFDAWWADHPAGAPIDVASNGSYSLPAVATSGCSYDTWGPPTSTVNAPAARAFHSAVWTGAEMIVWGGSQLSSPFNDGARYDPATDTWGAVTSTSGNVPSARRGHSAVWTGTEMIVWGGTNAGGTLLDTGGRYNPATDTWGAPTSTVGNAPVARYGHTAVWTGTEMIVWGGYTGSGWLDSGGRYDPASNAWGVPTSTGTNVPTARVGHAAVWTDSEMLVWGGVGNNGVVNTGGRYNPTSDAWGAPTSTSGNVPSPREDVTAVWTGTQMIVWGGLSNSNLNTGGRYDPSNDTWGAATSTSGNIPTGRSAHSAVWTGTEMIAWGGADQLNYYLDTGGRYCGSGTTGVEGGSSPTALAFADPWPNPSSRAMNLDFTLPARAAVSAEVVDVAGRRVVSLLNHGSMTAGAHRLEWDGRDASGRAVAPGVYLIRISAGAAAAMRRLIVIP